MKLFTIEQMRQWDRVTIESHYERSLSLMEVAAQACAVNQSLNIDPARVNVNGGAIAIGHPIGASGCRILVTLLHEMQRSSAKKGLAALCIGGGMGVALALER